MESLSSFNHVSNLHGEHYRVIFADTAQCSEGVSFLAVRRMFLTDVPSLHSSFVQVCGRSIRMYGHRGLPENEQQVYIQLYAASLPAWMKSPLACWALRAQRRHWTGKNPESGAKALLKKLESVGIRNLSQLKADIDKLGIHENTSSASEKAKPFYAKIGYVDNATEACDSENGMTPRQNSTGMLQAIRALASVASADEATLAESLALSLTTADEIAIKELARQSHELAPALAGMRAWAVDKDIVNDLASPGARASGMPLWSNKRLHMQPRCDLQLDGCTSIVLHSDSAATLPRRRLRRKTNVDFEAAYKQSPAPLPLQDLEADEVKMTNLKLPSKRARLGAA
jgi:hypothetical protein